MMRIAAWMALAATVPGQVQTGLDVLVAEGFARLRGRKVGLITNHTGLAADGSSIVELLLRADGVELKTLFSPEHGFKGVLDQSKIADATHGSGLSIKSLYGKTRKPTAEMLRGIDTLVFDIQDIGCRFYTYVSTMGLAMEAAAERGLRFVVLDRPNPIGGHVAAGPVLDPGKESFVGYWRVPVRHGMTAGELAKMFAAEKNIDVDLRVVEIRGWKRAMYFDATGLTWINPSPNMRSLTQATLYPGIGLLEFTNLSVGRGTDTPFELIGAPWIDGRRLAHHLNAAKLRGVRCVPIRFTPTASKFKDQPCAGVNFIITDRAHFDPLALGIHAACALRDLHPERWQHERYARLLSDDATFDRLCSDKPPHALIAGWQIELAEFGASRKKYLLY